MEYRYYTKQDHGDYKIVAVVVDGVVTDAYLEARPGLEWRQVPEVPGLVGKTEEKLKAWGYTLRPTITPHKGGRTESISLRLTEDELAALDRKRGNVSRSDYIMQLVNAAPEAESDE